MEKDKPKQIPVIDLSSKQVSQLDLMMGNDPTLATGPEIDYGKSKYDTSPVSLESLTSGSYNYLRGERQSNIAKWGVGLGKAVTKLGVRTLNGIASPIYGIGSSIYNWDISKLWDNDVTAITSDIEKSIDENMKMYSTKAAEDAKGFAKLGYVNFWANDVLDGISYSGAAMLSGAAWAKALKGIASLKMFNKLGSVDEAAVNLSKVDDQTKYLIELDNKSNLLKDGLKNGTIAALGASTEASVEAYNGANEWEKQMIQQLSTNPDGSTRQVTQAELDYVKQLRKSVGNAQYALNLPVIMASNWLTFGKTMLGNKTTERLALKDLADDMVNVDGVWKANTKSTVQKIIDKTYGAKKAIGKAVPEGFEELEQYTVEKGVGDYYTKKYYNPESASFIESMAAGINAAMTEEGLEQFLVGAVSGGIFGNTISLRKEGLSSYKSPYDQQMNSALEYINAFKGKESFKSAVEMLNRHANLNEELEKNFKEGKEFEIANNRSDMFVNYVNHMINMGKTNDLRSELESYKKLSQEEFEDILGIKLDTKKGTALKESVNEYIDKRLNKIAKIEDLSNKLDELFPNLKTNIKDRFMHTAWTLEDARDRTLTLNQEVKELIANEIAIANEGNLLSTKDFEKKNISLESLRRDYIFLNDKNQRSEYKKMLNDLNISPFIKDRVLNKVNDLDKLIERREKFELEYKSLSNPKLQELLSQLDEVAEEKVAETITNDLKNKQETEEKQKSESYSNQDYDSQDTSEEIDLHKILTGNVPVDAEQESLRTDAGVTSEPINTVSDLEAKKADIERRRQEELDKESYRTTTSSKLYKAEDGTLYKVEQQANGQSKISETNEKGQTVSLVGTYDSSVSFENIIDGGLTEIKDLPFTNKIVDKINAKYDAELAALEDNKSTKVVVDEKVNDEYDEVSSIIVDTDRNNATFTSETQEENLDSPKTFDIKVSPFVAMMSLFKMNKQNKTWKRNNNGEVEKDNNSDITHKVNNPDFANVGSKVNFEIVEIGEQSSEENNKSIANDRKLIAEFRKKNPNGPYSKRDEDFTDPVLTANIAITQNGELIGFLPLPHYIPYPFLNDESLSKEQKELINRDYNNLIALRKALIEVREKIVNGQLKETTIADKGAGKLLTRLDSNKNGKPVLNPIPQRDEDNFDGIGLYMYDNGESIVPFGDVDSSFLEDIDKVKEIASQFADKSFNSKRIFKAVRSANGTYRVIPVYTSKLNDDTVNKVVDILKNSNIVTEEDYKATVAALQDYVFATSINNDKYKDVINAIKISSFDNTIHIAGNKFNLEDIKNGKSIKVLKDSLRTLSHNINGNKINTKAYQDMLNGAGVLQTNAYLDSKSGEFFVQPYIELNIPGSTNLNEESESISTKVEPTTESTSVDEALNNVANSFNEEDENSVFSTTKFDGNLSKAHKVLSKILPGLTFADVEEIAKVSPYVKDAYGMFKNMTVYLFEGATDRTAYHEAFHGVFRNMLSDNQRITILKEAESKFKKPTDSNLNSLKSLPGNGKLSNEQLTQLYYEEKLADEFANFIDFKVNQSLGSKILNFFKRIFKLFNIFNRYTTGQIETLFDSVYSGKYATVSKLANRSIDSEKFASTAYSKIVDGILLSTQLERTRSIAEQFLSKYNAAIATGKKLTSEEQNAIFQEIRTEYYKTFETENAKPEDKRNKTVHGISAKIVKNFSKFEEEARKEIERRKIKLIGNLSSHNAELYTGENEDGLAQELNEDLSQGNTTKEFGQEMTSISGIRTATDVLKLFLSSIPVMNNGQVVKDSYGFTKFHRMETLYYYLERQLSTEAVINFNQISKILNKAAVYKPEYKQILDAIDNISNVEQRDSLKRQFSSNFSKQVLNYKLVIWEKKNNRWSFKVVDANRKNVKTELREKFKGNSKNSNLQDPSNSVMDKYRIYDENTSMYKWNVEALQELRKELDLKDYDVSQFDNVLRSIGLNLEPDVLALIYDKEKKALLQDVKSFLDGIIHNRLKSQSIAITNIINKNLIASADSFTTSFNNVENSVVYSIQNQSFASRLTKKLSNAISATELAKELSKDPMYKNNSILKFAIENPGMYQMFYIDGLKGKGDSNVGSKFNQIHKDDYDALALNLYISGSQTEDVSKTPVAYYSPIIPAEKQLAVIYQGPRYTVNIDTIESYDSKLKTFNKVLPNSQIVNLYYNKFVEEALRIQSALKDKVNNVKPIEKYHYKKDPTKWDGNAYQFHNIKFFKNINHVNKSITADIVKYLEENINDPNAVENLSRNNPELFNEIKDNITSYLNHEIVQQAKSFLNKGLISVENGKLTSNVIDTNLDIAKLISEFTLNHMLFNIENSLLNNGDPAFYKNESDFGKRFYQSLSMTKKIDKSLLDNSFKYLKDGKMKFNILKDYNTSTKSDTEILSLMEGHEDFEAIKKILDNNYKSNDINVTDAQVFASQAAYLELKKASGNTNQDFEIRKPFIYGTQWSEEYKRMIPVQIKCAIFPLTDEYVKHNPLLKKYKDKMDADPNYPQFIGFESAFKAILPQPGLLQGNDSFIDVDLESFGDQVDNRDHSVDDDNSSMRQLKMLQYGIMENDKKYVTEVDGKELTGAEIKNLLLELESTNVIEASEKLSKMFKDDKKGLNELIKEAVTKRGATSVTEAIFNVLPNGEFEYNLDLTNHTQVIQMISSLFSKKVIRQEFKGGSYVQASSLGYRGNNLAEQQSQLTAEELELQTDLQWIKKNPKDPNSIDYIDIAVTAPSEEFYKHLNPDGTIKDSLPEELKQMLVYRIPNEGAHSDMVCRIKYILPKGHKNTILMPYEVTKQFGADFDFDKTFFIYKHFFTKKDGSFIIPKYNDGTDSKDIKDRYSKYVSKALSTNKEARKLVKEEKEYIDEANKIRSEQGYELLDDSFFKKIVPELVDAGYIKSFEEFSQLPVALQNTKEARDNKIVELYMGLLRHKNMLKSMITPSGPGEILEFYKEYNMKLDNNFDNYFSYRGQSEIKDLFHSISFLKGVMALHVTSHSFFTNGNVILANPIKVYRDGKSISYDSLSKVMSDAGNKIVEEISSMMAAVLDAVKTPDLLPALGITNDSANYWSILVRTGMGIKLASAITSQKAVKEHFRALGNSNKELKEKGYTPHNIEKTLAFYKEKYAKTYKKVYDRIASENPGNKFLTNDYFHPEFVNSKSPLDEKNLFNFIGNENKFIEYLKEDSNVNDLEQLNFFKAQVESLRVIQSLEKAVNEAKEMNTIFSSNKEVGPNFENINQIIELSEKVKSEFNSALEGKESLVNNRLVKSYIDTYKQVFDIISSHFMFASDTFNEIKNNIALAIKGTSDLLKIKTEHRELLNNFIRSFLDSATSFKDVYNGNNPITEKEYMYEMERILLSVDNPNKPDTHVYKLLGDRTLSSKEKIALRNTGVLSQLKVDSIPKSDKKYLNLKANRLELAEKELFIGSLISLYESLKYKTLAENLIKYTFKTNGFYTGLNSFYNLIHPKIAVGLRMQDERNKIKAGINRLDKVLNDPDLFNKIKDQAIRNYSKKFTKVFDNDKGLTFTKTKEGNLILVNDDKNPRLREILITKDEESTPIEYLRFKDDTNLVKLFRLNTSISNETSYIYEPVSMLGYEGLFVEINPFDNLNKSEIPANNYEVYTPKNLVKKVFNKEGELVDAKEDEQLPNTENLHEENGTERNDFIIKEEDVEDMLNESKPVNLFALYNESLNNDLNADTPLVEETEENLQSTDNLITFENSFTMQEQKIILNNFTIKFNISREQALSIINAEILKKPNDAISKLKECYL